MANFLIKTAESEVKQDKNERNYKTIDLTEAVMMQTPFGLVPKPHAQCRTTRIKVMEQSYLNDKEELGYSDPIFNVNNPAKGGIFEGAIVTRNVQPYEVNGRIVTTYSTAVFGNSSDPSFEAQVKSRFKSAGKEIVENVTEAVVTENVTTVNI